MMRRLVYFLVAVTAALVVGKAVLVANATPFLRRYDTMPLAWTILYKAGVYCAFVFVARVIESSVEGWLRGTPFTEFLATFSWHRFLAIQIWLFVLFLVYVTIHELNMLFGDGDACAHPRPSLRGAGAFVCLCVSTD